MPLASKAQYYVNTGIDPSISVERTYYPGETHETVRVQDLRTRDVYEYHVPVPDYGQSHFGSSTRDYDYYGHNDYDYDHHY